MARTIEQRLADLEKTVVEFFTGRSKKTSTRKGGKKTGKPAKRSAKKAKKPRKTSKRKSAR